MAIWHSSIKLFLILTNDAQRRSWNPWIASLAALTAHHNALYHRAWKEAAMEQYAKYLRKSRFDRDYAELSVEETLKRHEAILDK